VTLEAEVDGELRRLAGPESFRVVDLGGGTLPVDDPAAALAFQRLAADLQRAVLGAVEAASEMNERLDHLRQAILDTPGAGGDSLVELAAVEAALDDVLVELRGDRSRARRNEPVPPSIRERVDRIVDSGFFTTQPPTTSHRDGFRYASDAFVEQLAALRALEGRLTALEATLEAAGAPWTPGRLPTWPRGE
jgi:hypothetical protein